MLDRPAQTGDVLQLAYDSSKWLVKAVDAADHTRGTVVCVGVGTSMRWKIGVTYLHERLVFDGWSLVEDDFTRWVREVREENGSDLCSL